MGPWSDDIPEGCRRRPAAALDTWNEQIRAFRRSVAVFQSAVQRWNSQRATWTGRPRVVLPVMAPSGHAALPVARPAVSERVAEAEAQPTVLPVPRPALSQLTRRQTEVANLIARGYSNSQIAEELVLTPGTVANHVAHIMQRLSFKRRSQVAVWAVVHGLHSPIDGTSTAQTG